MNAVRVIEVIETTSTRGNGKDDPVRIVTEYWSKEGEKLAEVDHCDRNLNINDAEKMALEQARQLLKEFCNSNAYYCVKGSVGIDQLFLKLL